MAIVSVNSGGGAAGNISIINNYTTINGIVNPIFRTFEELKAAPVQIDKFYKLLNEDFELTYYCYEPNGIDEDGLNTIAANNGKMLRIVGSI